jgi:hypothetical protein
MFAAVGVAWVSRGWGGGPVKAAGVMYEIYIFLATQEQQVMCRHARILIFNTRRKQSLTLLCFGENQGAGRAKTSKMSHACTQQAQASLKPTFSQCTSL